MAVTSAISDFVASIFELFKSVFTTAYNIVHSIFTAAFNFVSGIFNLVTDLLSGVFDVAGGIGKFVAGNVVVIALVGAGVFAYMRYTAQGQKLATGKKND